jgi:hypothetical protein
MITIEFVKRTKFWAGKNYLALPGEMASVEILTDVGDKMVVEFMNGSKAILNKGDVRSPRSNDLLGFLNSMRNN